ncbi:hypothetical protein Acr_09g0009600 [Actinidia rufa]|uniref:Uncharacterized protein n=1 Tax=Actinidia rufa TaxID=165716 RepID=A0A7J0F741_9ERIC|nr:hypothetical protein Acr_09g0009600 [Actinidia rufa]
MVSSKSSFHARSVSFPSQPHQLISQVDDHLCRLRTSEATSSSSLSSIAERLSVNEKWVEEVVDGYLHLLDLCAAAKDVSSQTKQDVQDLLSSLRRRRDGSELGGYLTSRKKAKKVIQKSLKNLKSIKSKHMHKDLDTEAIFTLLKEVEVATGKKVEPQDEETNTNEFEKVDAALNLLLSRKTGRSENKVDLEKVQNQLQTMTLGIQDLEGGLECLFRRFIKTRVSLLNILNH